MCSGNLHSLRFVWGQNVVFTCLSFIDNVRTVVYVYGSWWKSNEKRYLVKFVYILVASCKISSPFYGRLHRDFHVYLKCDTDFVIHSRRRIQKLSFADKAEFHSHRDSLLSQIFYEIIVLR